MLAPHNFFDLEKALHAAAFDDSEFCWDVLKTLHDYILDGLERDFPPGIHPQAQVHPSAVVDVEQVYVGEGAVIMPHANVEGPAIISAGAKVAQGAYVRADVVLSPGAVVGHACEAKNALLLEDAHVAHFNYVGDSVLGARANLGAGAKLSNLAINSAKDAMIGKRPVIVLTVNNQTYDTGLSKFGAIIGDDVQLGCNTVSNPGTLVAPRTLVYAMALLRKGYYPPDSIVKVRQAQEIIERQVL